MDRLHEHTLRSRTETTRSKSHAHCDTEQTTRAWDSGSHECRWATRGSMTPFPAQHPTPDSPRPTRQGPGRVGSSQVHVLTAMTSQRKDARLEPGTRPRRGRAGGVCNRRLAQHEGRSPHAPPAPTGRDLDGQGSVSSVTRGGPAKSRLPAATPPLTRASGVCAASKQRFLPIPRGRRAADKTSK